MAWVPVAVLRAAVAACAIGLCLSGPAAGARRNGPSRHSPPPLVGEELGSRLRKFRKPAECQFGGRMYELEDVWHPDLGPPFGVMYCVRCECLPVPKKRRVVGRVRCKNVKNECAKPTCEEPVLLPGNCCKACQENKVFDEIKDVAHHHHDVTGEDEKSLNEFAALLTGLGMRPPVVNSVVGSGRFSFHRRSLYYTIYLGRNESVTHVRFVDKDASILEEQELDDVGKSLRPNKVCGVWKKIPKIYRKLLKEEKIYVELLLDGDNPEGSVQGWMTRYRSLSTETFSALLRPSEGAHSDGAGGFAVISTVSNTGSIIHVLLSFNGIVRDEDPPGTQLVLRLETEDKILLQDTMKLAKPNTTYNMLEWKMEVSLRELRLLVLGRTTLTLASKLNPERKLTGKITPKQTCNVFQGILSTTDSTDGQLTKHNAVGLTLLNLNEDGSLSYKIYAQGLSSSVLALTIEATPKKRRQVFELLPPNFIDNWANGTYQKLTPRDVEELLADELYVNIATQQNENELRGRVTQKLYTEAHMFDAPMLLTSGGTMPPGKPIPGAGIAWMNVDTMCKLHIAVSLITGMSTAGGNKRAHNGDVQRLELVDNIPSSGEPSGFDKHLLLEFVGNDDEVVIEDLDKSVFHKLESGMSYLQITKNFTSDSNVESITLQAQVKNVRVPHTCADRFGQRDSDKDTNEIPGETYSCIYESKLFEDGAQWTAEHDSCSMCSCQRGRVVCDSVVCPRLECSNPVTLSGQCCPSCPDKNLSTGCYFDGDNRWHPVGTAWHPYIPPFGFSTCAVCECDSNSLKVECKRITCHTLLCPDKDAIRLKSEDCCKVCPDNVTVPPVIHNVDKPQDEGSAKNSTDILSEGGCEFSGDVYSNGKEWHPRLQPFGEEKCIKCNCKDGDVKCRRQRCPVLHCENQITDSNHCCLRCEDGSPNYKYSHKGTSSKRRKTKYRQ